jgi:2-amino-4-hydroxy-6-hydroxymethyldihydropteridine diphosphokinase
VARAFLGLGSNLGDREGYLRDAVAGLAAAPGVAVVAVSDVYETDPVGGPEQGPYLNIVVELATDVSARELLELARRLEAQAERVREERWGPRTLDVDVLWIDDVELDTPDLTVPHPRMWERRFVLAPLSELAPELLPDDWERRAEGEVRRRGRL